MKKISTLLIIISTIIFSCESNEPVIADFYSLMDPYSPGKYNFTNMSTNANTYEWDDGLGNKYITKNVTIQFPKNGIYNVTLTARGPSGQNSKSESINVTNMPTTGDNVVFTRLNTEGSILVNIDGINVGNITRYQISGIPDCGTSGFININKKEGTYVLIARSQTGKYWASTITFTAGVCRKFELK